MTFEPKETEIQGGWIIENGVVVNDASTERIFWLIKNSLIKIDEDESGWDTLYQDSKDGRFWKLTYPNSEMHGGGPPLLSQVR